MPHEITDHVVREERLLVSRRALLRRSGLLLGGIGAGTLLASCGPAAAPLYEEGSAVKPGDRNADISMMG